MRLERGDLAPIFALPDDEGRVLSSKDLRGSRHLIYFYPRDDTRGCTAEACQFNDHLARFESLGIPVIGISPDDADSHQAFRAKYGLRFMLLSDPRHEVLEAYGAWGRKSQGRDGVIRSSFLVGADGRIERAWYAVRADGHAIEVLAAIQGTL